MEKQKIAFVIHGGAGTISKDRMTPEMEEEYQTTLKAALREGYTILENGGAAVDAVEKAIRLMEDAPFFNAGKGSVFTNDSVNELDASIMDGKTLNAGAVAAVRTIKNPITAARLVMEKSEHVMLTGKGAEIFARQNGLEIVDPSYFFDQKRFDQLKKAKQRDEIYLDHDGDKGLMTTDEDKYGTVGAVALDQFGNLAAGTSTGGMTNKKFGRVGDTPIIGAGTYANNKTCAVSGTGHGEFFMRNVVAYDVSALMEYKGLSLTEAAKTVIHKKLAHLGGKGGVIALDMNGNIALEFNTEGMFRGYIDSKGKIEVAMFGNQ